MYRIVCVFICALLSIAFWLPGTTVAEEPASESADPNLTLQQPILVVQQPGEISADNADPIPIFVPDAQPIVPSLIAPDGTVLSEPISNHETASQDYGNPLECSGDCSCSCSDCSRVGHWITNFELVVLDYDREQGVRVGGLDDEVVGWNMKVSPRVTVGWQGPSNTGIRCRWWIYDHDRGVVGNEPNSRFSVNNYNVDCEWFGQYQLTYASMAEVSCGVRYNSFSETMRDHFQSNQPQDFYNIRMHSFKGIGPVCGIEFRQQSPFGGTLYARCRGAVLWDDLYRTNDWYTPTGNTLQRETLPNATQSVFEVAAGIQLDWCLCNGALLTGQVGFEYQNWHNYSSRFQSVSDTGENTWNGRSDVNYVGFTCAAGVGY